MSAALEVETMGRQTTKERPANAAARYEDDLYTWVQEQVALLRSGRLTEIDALNIAEELSDAGNEQFDKLESSIAVLAQHLLKWDHQPRRRSRSWTLTIREQRRRISKHLKKNPGLKAALDDALDGGYSEGRTRAIAETNLAEIILPDVCPYPFDEMMTRVIEIE